MRMGQDKARLKVGAYCLVELVANVVREAAGNVALVGNPAVFADLPLDCLADLQPGLGPLAGLEAVLASGRGELNLVVGCDMPGLSGVDLRCLLESAQKNRALCTVAVDMSGRRHPLCAVYRSEALPTVRSALAAGRLRLLDMVEELKAVDVRIDAVLSNLNTPEQWAAWQADRLV